jgi:inosine-uridine nucleoside N-ribohydrolase
VLVGGNLSSRGRWPPWWPHEFNLTHDRAATAAVIASSAPLTVVPLDVASAFRFDARDLGAIHGALGDFLRRGARRWRVRTRLLKFRGSFPIWDLLAAMWLIAPGAIATRQETVRAHPNAWIEFGAGTREVTVVTGFDRGRVWRDFLDRMA